MTSISKLPNGKYQVRWRDNRRQRMRNVDTKMQAIDLKRQIDFGEKEEPASVAMLFNTYADRWTERYAKLELSPASQLKASKVLKYHLLPAFGKIALGEFKRAHLLELRETLKKAGLANKTVNDIETWAKTMLSVAVDWGLIQASPWRGMKRLKVHRKMFGYWTAAERDRFLAHCRRTDPPFAELVMVATWTGLRRGELQALQVRQLDFDRKIIQVDATYSEHLKQRLDRTKGGTTEWVPMAAVVYDALKTRMLAKGSDRPVFNQYLFADCYDRLQRRCKEAGVKPIRFHDLRHTAASIWVMAGKPLYTVQKLMRHKSIAMTEKYAHLSPDYLAGAAELDSATFVRLAHESVRNQL